MKRFLMLIGVLAALTTSAAPLRIHLIGDSTCATKDLAGENPERGWGQMFEPLFDEGVEVLNHALNGRSTKSFRDEGHWTEVLSDLREGDYLFIQFGHNDQKLNDSTRYVLPEAYAENLRRYIREARERGARPVVLTSVVRRHFTDGRLDDTHGAYLDAARRTAAEEHTPLIDAERLTRTWIEGLGDAASRNFFVWVEAGTCPRWPDGREDNTHLNVRGARTVARLIAAQLPATLPELGRHLVGSDFTVARDGSGDFFTLTEAVAAVPDFGRDTTRIVVCEGVYREKISIPATKRLVALTGRGAVTVSWNDHASETGPTGHRLGTSGSSTVYFGGEGWTVRHMTFENTAGRVGQAVAVQCLATNLRFIGCRFLGNQDTLYLYGVGNRDGERVAENARIRFEGCYIEGTTDFIFGSAAALFRRCEIRSKADSYVTAASTCRGQRCGMIFEECRLTADEGVTSCWLGRPWRDYAQTLFLRCWLGGHIRPEGWHDWDKPRARRTVRYGEYACEGPGAAPKARVGWSRQLSAREARQAIADFDR